MPTTEPNQPRGGTVRLETLSEYECWQLVSGAGPGGIARVVWSGQDGPAVVPVNYAVADGALWFQTSFGSRLATECPGQRVLVELDRVEPVTHLGWSVVVTGTATCLPASADPGILGKLLVWPAGSHHALVKVEPDELSGRRLRRQG